MGKRISKLWKRIPRTETYFPSWVGQTAAAGNIRRHFKLGYDSQVYIVRSRAVGIRSFLNSER